MCSVTRSKRCNAGVCSVVEKGKAGSYTKRAIPPAIDKTHRLAKLSIASWLRPYGWSLVRRTVFSHQSPCFTRKHRDGYRDPRTHGNPARLYVRRGSTVSAQRWPRAGPESSSLFSVECAGVPLRGADFPSSPGRDSLAVDTPLRSSLSYRGSQSLETINPCSVCPYGYPRRESSSAP